MIKSKIRTTVKNQVVVDKFLQELAKARNSYVTIGVHEDAGEYPDADVSVVEVALWNEFGTRYSPERAWMRTTMDENEGQLNRWREELIGKMMGEGWSVEKALDAMGFRIMTLLQNKIKSNMPPPNAQSTIDAKAKKGVSPSTLMDSQLMLRSVTYRVVIAA